MIGTLLHTVWKIVLSCGHSSVRVLSARPGLGDTTECKTCAGQNRRGRPAKVESVRYLGRARAR